MENNEEYQKWLEVVEEDGMELENVPEKYKTLDLCEVALESRADSLDFVPEKFKTGEQL